MSSAKGLVAVTTLTLRSWTVADRLAALLESLFALVEAVVGEVAACLAHGFQSAALALAGIEAVDERLEHVQPLLRCDVPSNRCLRDVACRRGEIASRPQGWKLAKLRVLLPQLMRSNALDRLKHVHRRCRGPHALAEMDEIRLDRQLLDVPPMLNTRRLDQRPAVGRDLARGNGLASLWALHSGGPDVRLLGTQYR